MLEQPGVKGGVGTGIVPGVVVVPLENSEFHITVSGKELLKLEEPQGLMIGVVFNPDGSCLASSSNNGTAKIWDT